MKKHTLKINKNFREGMIDSSPVCLSFALVFFSVGSLSAMNGFSLSQSIAFTALVFAAPLQILLLQYINELTLWMVVLMSVAVNFRFLLLSASITPYFEKENFLKVALSMLTVSASTFAVSYLKFQSQPTIKEEGSPFYYYLGVSLTSYVVAIFATMAGYQLGEVEKSSLFYLLVPMILPIHFTVLTAKLWPKVKPILATVLGFLLFPFGFELLGTYAFFIVPFLIGGFLLFYDELFYRLKK